MTDETYAAAWLTLGCLVWLGIGTVLMVCWGDREKWEKSFFDAFPDLSAAASARPKLITGLFHSGLFFMAALWPFSMRGPLKALFRRS